MIGMMPQRKKLAQQIIDSMGKEKVQDSSVIDDREAGIMSAIERLMISFEARDAKGLASGLRSAFEMMANEREIQGGSDGSDTL